jgi:hypothetical protein
MALNRMKHVLLLTLVFAMGALCGGYAVYHHLGNMMLWGLYMEASKNATVYISVLEDVENGRTDKAVSNLELFLGTSEAILMGCQNDLCKDGNQEMVSSALLKIDAYKKRMSSQP